MSSTTICPLQHFAFYTISSSTLTLVSPPSPQTVSVRVCLCLWACLSAMMAFLAYMHICKALCSGSIQKFVQTLLQSPSSFLNSTKRPSIEQCPTSTSMTHDQPTIHLTRCMELRSWPYTKHTLALSSTRDIACQITLHWAHGMPKISVSTWEIVISNSHDAHRRQGSDKEAHHSVPGHGYTWPQGL